MKILEHLQKGRMGKMERKLKRNLGVTLFVVLWGSVATVAMHYCGVSGVPIGVAIISIGVLMGVFILYPNGGLLSGGIIINFFVIIFGITKNNWEVIAILNLFYWGTVVSVGLIKGRTGKVR